MPAADLDAALIHVPTTTLVQNSQSKYYWNSQPVAGGAQLMTLFCHSCRLQTEGDKDIPLVAVLRDTLGDATGENDRLRYVWLLSYVRPTVGQRLLSAVPFFFWHVGSNAETTGRNTSPLIDVSQPASSTVRQLGRELLQWTALDPMTTPVRASSRAYRTNEIDHQRLHLEEAISYLREAPAGASSSGLTQSELDLVIARLSLRKRLLGGLVNAKRAEQIGREDTADQEKVRSRNWEMLRQSAERTGLVFESIKVANSTDQYAVLWFPLDQPFKGSGVSLQPVWKLLNIKDPWSDERVQNQEGQVFTRSFDTNGSLLPSGVQGVRTVRVMPLGVYNLNYPKLPLLLVDFRDRLRVRRTEMTQRAIEQVVTGVLGLSHFTNWYYYAGQAAYQFVVARHGAAVDRAERLDCYSQFRVALALDRGLDPELRGEMQRRVDSLSLNPLETAPDREIRVAQLRYEELTASGADGGKLELKLDRDRRAELALFGESRMTVIARAALHDLSIGAYTARAKSSSDNIANLDRNRRVQVNLEFLDTLVEAGTDPNVVYGSARVQASVSELAILVVDLPVTDIKEHALETLHHLKTLSQDAATQVACARAIDGIKAGVLASPSGDVVASVNSPALPLARGSVSGPAQ